MAFQFVHESLVREYNFPSKCYPRFRYFQKHYEGLLPELKKVEEYASYYKIDSRKYKSLSDQNYDSIGVTVIYNKNTANKPLASKLVKVQVSAKVDIEKKVAAKKDDDDKQVSAHLDEEKQVSAKLDVEKQASAKLDDEKLVAAKFDDGKQDSVQLDDDEQKFPMKFKVWNTQQRGRIDNKVLNITVFMINEKKDLALHKWFICYNMSEERMKNVVLHDVESNVSSTYEDMVKNNFKFKYDEDNKTSTLSSTIQYLLEYNVVSVLNEIKKFICHIEEHFHDEENKLTQSSAMKNHPSEEDLSKMPKTYVDSANNRSLERVGKKHGTYVDNPKNRKLGRVGLDYGMSPEPKQGPSSADQKEYSGEWGHKLQAKGEEFSDVQSPDTLAGEMRQLKIDSQSQFQVKDRNFEQLPDMSKQPSEEEVKERKKTMTALKFEINGLLRQTRIVHIRESVQKPYPKPSNALKIEILKIPEIVGCGTAYGQLVMHMSRGKTPEGPSDVIRIKVKQLLKTHNYSNGYTIELIGEIKDLSFKQGDKTEASIINRENRVLVKTTEFGTLGCFVNVKNRANNIFGITCAHCVRNYDNEIEIFSSDEKAKKEIEKHKKEIEKHKKEIKKYKKEIETHKKEIEKHNKEIETHKKEIQKHNKEIETHKKEIQKHNKEIEKHKKEIEKYKMTGIRSHDVHWTEIYNVDIAAIEIKREDYKNCDTSLKLENGVKCENWTFEEGYPNNNVSKVYKRGSETHFTQGRIYIHEYNDKHSMTNDVSKRVSSILIENGKTTSAIHQHCCVPFSAQGDSGSVVWYEDLGPSRDEPVATVIGLVFKGAEHEHDGTFEYTICCPIKRSIEELEEKFRQCGENCTFEPARESSKT